MPVEVVDVEVLVFFMPLLPFILDLRSMRPFILEPLCISDDEPFMLPLCIVPLCMVPEPLVVPVVVPLCIVPEVVPLCIVPEVVPVVLGVV